MSRADRTRPGAIAAVVATLAMLAVTLVACAGGARHPPAPLLAPTPDTAYVIGPLDVLNVVVWRNPELSTTLTVRPDGFVSTPLVDEVRAAGRTPEALRQELERRLATYVLEPRVSVIVSGFQGVYARQIRIVGEAAHPQSVPYRQDMTLLDVMIAVGGVTDFADANAAVLVRAGSGGAQTQFGLRIKDLLRNGDISANVAVAPGDIIIVPQSWF